MKIESEMIFFKSLSSNNSKVSIITLQALPIVTRVLLRLPKTETYVKMQISIRFQIIKFIVVVIRFQITKFIVVV